MASLMENLLEVLDQESAEYEGLVELSQKKAPIIVGGNLEKLQKITDDEQIIVSRLHNLEKKREEVTADIANVLNRDVETLKLANLIDMLSGRPEERTKLAEVHDRLQNAVHALQRINEQNKELLEDALEVVKFEMNRIQAMRSAPETANYTRGAYTAGDTMGVARSGFDAKQ